MEDMKKELELLKQLPVQRRIELLEEKVLDLEYLMEKYNEFFKLHQYKFMGLETLKIKNAELRKKLEIRRLETISYLIFLINILVIMTQKWDILLLYLFALELIGALIWMGWVAFLDSK